jgi:shikimate kinase
MQDRGHVVYLRSSPEELIRRLRHDTHRPLLQVRDPVRKLRELFRDRDPLYREAARFVIETGRPSVKMLAGTILMQLELAGVIDPAHVPSPVATEPER